MADDAINKNRNITVITGAGVIKFKASSFSLSDEVYWIYRIDREMNGMQSVGSFPVSSIIGIYYTDVAELVLS